jgi:hypothetical protein
MLKSITETTIDSIHINGNFAYDAGTSTITNPPIVSGTTDTLLIALLSVVFMTISMIVYVNTRSIMVQ